MSDVSISEAECVRAYGTTLQPSQHSYVPAPTAPVSWTSSSVVNNMTESIGRSPQGRRSHFEPICGVHENEYRDNCFVTSSLDKSTNIIVFHDDLVLDFLVHRVPLTIKWWLSCSLSSYGYATHSLVYK